MMKVCGIELVLVAAMLIFYLPQTAGGKVKEKPQSSGEDKELKLGSTTMIITVSCIVGAFILALILQCLIKQLWNKKKFCLGTRHDESNHETGPGYLNHSIPEITVGLPSYEDIHLYKQLDLSSYSPVYYNIPGTKHYYGIIIRNESSIEEETEEPPFYYSSDEEDVEIRNHLANTSGNDIYPSTAATLV